METKSLPVVIEKATSAEFDGTWAISSDAVDRVGDVISTKALEQQVGKDVICLWQHQADQPIGKWTNLRMKGNKLVADLKLADTNLGQMIKALLDISTPLGASVGFRGQGKPREKGGYLFDSIEILETSVVSVPCNREAMQIAKSFGFELPADNQFGIDNEAAASPVESENQRKAVAALTIANATLAIKGIKK